MANELWAQYQGVLCERENVNNSDEDFMEDDEFEDAMEM